MSFTCKETDIYKIHQSGDLANLDGLDDDSLKLLPSLLVLRNALYSEDFRNYISSIAMCGPLSGLKTDMAINVYTPGCHLLCHDDVIGSRRVSYILYLLDPEQPWHKSWGGALRLYPTKAHKCSDGEIVEVPSPDWVRQISPAFNQLCFFGIQPGRTFHDVEEVYSSMTEHGDRQRVRIAISGWYHLPQKGEDGFVKGLAEETAVNSSRGQLQHDDEHDLPESNPQLYLAEEIPNEDAHSTVSHKANNETAVQEAIPMINADSQKETSNNLLTESEIEFLLKYLNPNYLTPDNVDGLRETFIQKSVVMINDFLNNKYSTSLRSHIESQPNLPKKSTTIDNKTAWTVARPPHKHRYLFMLPNAPDMSQSAQNVLTTVEKKTSPLKEILSVLLPSLAFKKWLHLATGLEVNSYDVRARRFRSGCDYTLGTTYEKEEPILEMTLGITTSGGWGNEEDSAVNEEANETDSDKEEQANEEEQADEEEDVEEKEDIDEEGDVDSQPSEEDDAATQPTTQEDPEPGNSTQPAQTPKFLNTKQPDNVGGYEVYMCTDSANASSAKVSVDPAVYEAAPEEDEDDSILFSMAAGWNRLSLVLRDKGVMRFVKYVSASAKGDRWDVVGEFGVVDEVKDEDEDEEEEGEGEEEEEEEGEGEEEDEEEGEEEGEGEEGGEDEESTTDLAEGAEAEFDSESD